MAIQNINQLLTAISAGQTNRFDWTKTTGGTAYTAGRYYEMFGLAGTPAATTYPGTALTWKTCNETTGDGTNVFGIQHGGNVSALVKNLMNMSYWTTVATGAPSTLMLVDLQGYYPGISQTINTAQTLLGTPTLRYTNGAGVRMSLVSTTLSGSTAQNISYSYTNTAGTASRTNPFTITAHASSPVNTVLNGVAGLQLPLASGDTGVKSVQTVTFSAANSAGACALLLYKPLASIVINSSSLPTEKDFLNQCPSFPIIPDGACLGFFLFAGAAVAAATPFSGSTEVVWG